MVLLSDVKMSSTQSARHCGASRHLQTLVRTIAQDRFFCLGICKESSWTSFRNLGSVTCFEMNAVGIYEDSE
jgi:hypothetical protein